MTLSTDPYGNLTFAIGDADDFWCFDYDTDATGMVRLHATINSETGSFIQDAMPPVEVPAGEAVNVAQGMIDAACEWCDDNDITHDADGWNQTPDYFVECVTFAVSQLQDRAK